METNKRIKRETSVATVQLQCNNPYSIACFEDFLLEAARHFDEEMNAKNRAYSFILQKNLVDEFRTFCFQNNSDDYHADCLKHIESLISDKN